MLNPFNSGVLVGTVQVGAIRLPIRLLSADEMLQLVDEPSWGAFSERWLVILLTKEMPRSLARVALIHELLHAGLALFPCVLDNEAEETVCNMVGQIVAQNWDVIARVCRHFPEDQASQESAVPKQCARDKKSGRGRAR